MSARIRTALQVLAAGLLGSLLSPVHLFGIANNIGGDNTATVAVATPVAASGSSFSYTDPADGVVTMTRIDFDPIDLTGATSSHTYAGGSGGMITLVNTTSACMIGRLIAGDWVATVDVNWLTGNFWEAAGLGVISDTGNSWEVLGQAYYGGNTKTYSHNVGGGYSDGTFESYSRFRMSRSGTDLIQDGWDGSAWVNIRTYTAFSPFGSGVYVGAVVFPIAGGGASAQFTNLTIDVP